MAPKEDDPGYSVMDGYLSRYADDEKEARRRPRRIGR